MTSSLHLVDPELSAGLAIVPSTDFAAADLTRLRADLLKAQGAIPAIAVPGVSIEERMIAGSGDAPDVGIRLFIPQGGQTELAALLDIHGGGYVMGAVEVNDSQNQELASELGCIVAAVRYRLAPETTHPGPVEDCYAALKWLHDNAEEFAIDRRRLAVIGSSAGGGLAAALALLVRDRAEIPLAAQFLLSPMLDDRSCVDPDPNHYAGEFVWTRESNVFGWRALLGMEPGDADISQYAAAARATSLDALAPTFLATGSLDLFVDENIDYARRLIRSGVPTEFHIYPGAFHGFSRFAPHAAVSQALKHDLLTAMQKLLGTPRSP